MRASAGEAGTNEVQQELPAVLTASDAKGLVQQMLAREWLRRDRLMLRLPPSRLNIEPGAIVDPGIAPFSWQVERCTIDGLVAAVELRPYWQPAIGLAAAAGRIVANSDVVEGPMSIALIQSPENAEPGWANSVGIAASCPNRRWQARHLWVTIGGETFALRTAPRKSVLGRALSVVTDGHVEVELIDPEQWLISCEEAALEEGVNLAVLGEEILQFGEATAIGDGRFRLGRLVRGLYGSGTADTDHRLGEVFCLLTAATIRTISVPPHLRGATIRVTDRYGSEAQGKVLKASRKSEVGRR